MTTRFKILALSTLAAVLGLAGACTGQKTGPGQLRVSMIDAPNPAVEQIWVNVTAVRAHQVQSGWVTISTTPVRVDLLTLKDHALELGLASLPAGTVTQIRLVVSSDGNTVKTGGVEVPLFVPSGAQSGIKIKGPWVIDACTETAVLLDFDGAKSIWYHPTGQGDLWILRPVIRTVKAEQAPGTCEPPGGTCVPAQCASGVCDTVNDRCAPGGGGTTCTRPEECLSGACTGGTCEPGGPGEPCRVGADCANGSCGDDGTCAPDGGGGAGTTCAIDDDCLSNTCDEGICAAGLQGAACLAQADCATGFACTAGACVEVPTTP